MYEIIRTCKEVTRTNKCPICGSPDWCCFITKYNSPGVEIVCKRCKEQSNQIGHDGREYVYVRTSQEGNSIFEEYSQYMSTQENADVGTFKPTQYTQKPLTVIDEVTVKSNTHLNKQYRFLLNQLCLEDYHKRYFSQNHWPEELLKTHSIASFPENDEIRTCYKNRTAQKNPSRMRLAKLMQKEFGEDSLIGVPGAYIDHGNWTFWGYSGILFPMYDMDGNVKRLRIRKDFLDVKYPLFKDSDGYYYINKGTKYHINMKGIYSGSGENKSYIDTRGKYRTLASFRLDEDAEKAGFYKNLLEKGCGSKNEYSCYSSPGDDWSIVIATEGEPKGLFTNYKMKNPVLTTSGTSSYLQLVEDEILSKCKERGMKIFVIATDADKHDNNHVMQAEKKLIQALKEKNMVVGLAEWDKNHGKGIDDFLASGRWPAIHLV